MILDCAHYRDGRRQDAGAIRRGGRARCTMGGFVWLGISSRAEELDEVREASAALAVEDAQKYHSAPRSSSTRATSAS